MEAFKYAAFVSYAHADEAWAQWLQRAVETYRIPTTVVKAQGLTSNRLQPVFRDRDDLPSATELSTTIEAALAESRALLVVCSPQAVASPWVNREIEAFHELGRTDQILCLLVDDPQASFPPAVLAQSAEPLAADPRPTGDGKNAAKLKIVAGMLHIGLDELRQRETQRRLQRLTYITAGALAGLAVASTLTVMTYLAQQESDKQRAIAVAQAEQTRLEAVRTTTVNEFLQDILKATDLEQGGIGRDVKLTDVLAAARASAAEQFADQPDIHAGILHTLGTSYLHRADYASASELLEDALQLRIEAGGEDTTDTAAAVNELGRLYHQLGSLAQAERYFRRALDILAPPLESSAERQGMRAAVQNNLGILLRDRGELEEAELHFRAALASKQALFGDVHEEVTPTLNNLGLLLSDLDQPAEALELFKQALAANRELWGPTHPLVGINLNNLAWAYLDVAELELAERSFNTAIDIKRASNGPEHPSTAISISGLGVTKARQGDVSAGLHDVEQALAVFETAYPADHWRLAYTQTVRARMLAQSGDAPMARQILQDNIEILDRVLGATHRRTVEARATLAELGSKELGSKELGSKELGSKELGSKEPRSSGAPPATAP